MENVAAEVTKKALSFIKEREQTEKEIAAKEAEADKAIAAAEKAQNEASERADFDAYTAAEKDLWTAKKQKEMYARQRTQVRAARQVTESESDAVIDSLLQYKIDLVSEFEKNLNIEGMKKALAQYYAAVDEADETIRLWTINVHQNYRKFNGTFGNGSNRAEKPQPVLYGESYSGLARIVRNFIEAVERKNY